MIEAFIPVAEAHHHHAENETKWVQSNFQVYVLAAYLWKKNYKNLVGVAYKQVLSIDRSLRYIRLDEERFVLFSLEKQKLNLREVSLSYLYPRLETKLC